MISHFHEVDIFWLITTSLLLGVFVVFSYLSIKERESRAAGIFIISGILCFLAFLVILYFSSFLWKILFVGLPWVIFLVLFLPIDVRKMNPFIKPKGRVDERDVMFSRRLLEEGTERYNEYYTQFPDRKTPDDAARSKPGLLSENAKYYNEFSFAAADASFQTVEQLAPAIDGPVAPVKKEVNALDTISFIKHWLKQLGAADIGCTLLRDYHLYSVRGRDHNYGEEVLNTHKYAIAFTVEMDREMMERAPKGPTVMESARKYMDAGAIAVQLGYFIRNLGYSARAHIDAHYEVVCPLVARDAGLGEIGRMGLLMTSRFGPRVRIGVVTTDIPLVTDEKRVDPTVVDFCERCKKCALVCPGQAISFQTRKEIHGVKRWQINQEKCYDYWCQVGTDCGRCIAVCPYAHPDNLLHRIVRFGIRNNYLFRRIAVPMDDLFYKKKPRPRPLQKWMK